MTETDILLKALERKVLATEVYTIQMKDKVELMEKKLNIINENIVELNNNLLKVMKK